MILSIYSWSQWHRGAGVCAYNVAMERLHLGGEAYEELRHLSFLGFHHMFHDIPKNISTKFLFSVILFACVLLLCEASKPSCQAALGASQNEFPLKQFRNAELISYLIYYCPKGDRSSASLHHSPPYHGRELTCRRVASRNRTPTIACLSQSPHNPTHLSKMSLPPGISIIK